MSYYLDETAMEDMVSSNSFDDLDFDFQAQGSHLYDLFDDPKSLSLLEDMVPWGLGTTSYKDVNYFTSPAPSRVEYESPKENQSVRAGHIV